MEVSGIDNYQNLDLKLLDVITVNWIYMVYIKHHGLNYQQLLMYLILLLRYSKILLINGLAHGRLVIKL
jgi:hypothetical protein